MSIAGLIGLLVAFAACSISLICLGVAHIQSKRNADSAEMLVWGGRLAAALSALALTFCCGVIVWCFFSGDVSLAYVVQNRSDASGDLAWLYTLAGLWAGRAGSLLFWAWLISVFAAILVFATRKRTLPLDNAALAVTMVVLIAFVGVQLFSDDNMPFKLLDASYFNEDGTLKNSASILGMNALLEHWAMAIHPPTLFIGYAGMTIPFAYAIAALATNDDSDIWVRRSTPYLMFSWLLLGIGIGLGAVWAYVVLGWGGYWGWDPVENASLLPWLVGVALIHSFTIYRKRGQFKRWSIMCACLAFCFVVLGTFITRSGIVQSVHAFEGDPVSLALFLSLIIFSLAAGIIGLIARRKTWGVDSKPEGTNEEDDLDSLVSREAAYYVNNLIMIVFAVLLAYMTLAPALPSWLPFGGQSLSAGTYNAIARPLGILYCALIAVCPLLGWHKTDPKAFWRHARIPLVCAIALFALLMFYFATYLLPSYNSILASGTSAAEGLLEQGMPIYYNGLTVVGFLVASLLFFNAGFTIVRAAKTGALRPKFAGSVCHTAMAVILVGLIGSSMYVTETTTYLPYDEGNDSVSESLKIQNYELVYTGNTVEDQQNGDDVLYTLSFDVFRDGQLLGSVSPSVQMIQSTQQQKLIASVMGFPLEDLFVVYRGMSTDGAFSMDVRVNPLITLVWIGFAMLMVGSALALFARRNPKVKIKAQEKSESDGSEKNINEGDMPQGVKKQEDNQALESAVSV